MNLDQLGALRVAIWGTGREGLALARLVIRRQVEPVFIDDDPRAGAERLRRALGGPWPVAAPADMRWDQLDVVVRSPGVSRYRPELAAARRQGLEVTTAMALWLEDFAEARVVAVTGTKGKSTTAALTASLLEADGRQVALIGNIGVPVTDTYDRPLADAYVVEVSSFQAADVAVTPGVVVLTSLAPDHLDWHGSEEAYYRDKLRLIEAGPPGRLAVNAASAEARRRTAAHPHRALFGPEGLVVADRSGRMTIDGTESVDTSSFRLVGEHNLWNLCGAVAGTALLDGTAPSPDAVAAVIEGFAGLPSRCAVVGERAGLTFVDDALASNPFATAASLSSFPGREVTVILGGADRGVDPGGLLDAIAGREPQPRVVLLPPDAERLSRLLIEAAERPAAVSEVHTARDLGDAVALATSLTPVGGVVLFSPAAPTPPGEGGYGARSRSFVVAAGLA